MFKRRLNNRYTGIYCTPDDINNLKLRVTLKKLYSIIHIPKFEKIQSSSTSDEPSIDFLESIELGWQEKILSKTEIKYFTQKENCKTDLEKRYHQMIKDNINIDENRLIFSYIHDDNYRPKDFYEIKNRKSGKGGIMERKITENEDSAEMHGSTLMKGNNLNEKEFSEMHIMADLDPMVLLFTIKYRKSDGLFIVYPDFNDNDNCYYLEVDQNSKQMYTYFMENISLITSKASKKIKQKQKLNDLLSETSEIMSKIVNYPKDEVVNMPKCRILLLFEISSAKNFEYDNIHIQYNIKLPKSVRLVEGELEGSTHSSFMNENIWNFGHCFFIVLDVHDEFLFSSAETENFCVSFDAISIDSLWRRERHEGTASLKLPFEKFSNSIEYDLNCCRFIQNGNILRDMIERFFFGGIRYTNLSTKTGDVQNLYGNLTVTTGVIKVKVQQIRQMQDSCSIHARMKTVDTIIDSYHKAKSKLSL